MVTISNVERADIKEDFFEAEKVAKQNIEDVKTSNDKDDKKDDKQQASQPKEAQPKEPTPLGPILPPPPGPIELNKEKTKEDLKRDYEIAKAKLERLQNSGTKINYIERDENDKPGRGGSYTTGKGTITIHPENIARSEGQLTKETTLQHERQHEIFDYATITTSDGKTFKALEAPMSLAQNYKLNQANEVGAFITELLTKRQKYINVHETRDGVKDELIKSLQKSADKPKVKELIEAVKNNQEITRDGNGNCSFKVGNEKVTVNLPEESYNRLFAYNDIQERVKEMEKQIGIWSEDERHGWYFKGVMNKTYNPLSKDPNTLKGELDNIGSGCASVWKKELGNEYSKQVRKMTEIYFKESNFQDIKQNDENYNKALSAGLTIGGYDFSNAVKGSLSVPEGIKKIDKEIANGTNKLDVMDKAAKEGVNLRKDDSENDIEDRMVAYLVKDKKITGKETVLEEKYVWTAEMIEKYKKGKEKYEKDCKEGKYTKEQRDIFDEKWEKIKNLDNKKPGEEGSTDELNNVLSIASAYRTAKVYDYPELLEIYFAADKQIDSNKVSEKEKDEYKKAYDKVKKEGDEAFEDLRLGSIKDDVNKVLSGREDSVDKELTKEQVTALKKKRDSMDTSQEKRAIQQEGGKLKSASIYDFTKPIVDPNRQQQIEQAKKNVERAQKRYEEATSKTPSQDNNKTHSQGNNQTNTKAADAKVIAAYKANQGR